MNRYQHCRKKAGKHKQHQQEHADVTEVNGISEIPFDATPGERYFLTCRDAEGMTLSVVCWDWQWSRFEGQELEGKQLTLDVRVPKEGFTAFTMV
jgi:hypothetical protein